MHKHSTVDVGDMTHVQATCVSCHRDFGFATTTSAYDRWQAGEHIQDVMPTLDANLRELMISGICGECFDKMFDDGDDPYQHPECAA